MRVPLSEEYITLVLLDHSHALPIGHQRYLVRERVLRAILLQSSIHCSILHKEEEIQMRYLKHLTNTERLWLAKSTKLLTKSCTNDSITVFCMITYHYFAGEYLV